MLTCLITTANHRKKFSHFTGKLIIIAPNKKTTITLKAGTKERKFFLYLNERKMRELLAIIGQRITVKPLKLIY